MSQIIEKKKQQKNQEHEAITKYVLFFLEFNGYIYIYFVCNCKYSILVLSCTGLKINFGPISNSWVGLGPNLDWGHFLKQFRKRKCLIRTCVV